MKALLAATLLCLPAVALAEVPMELTHQGRLFDGSGNALTGPQDVTFSLFDAPSSGTQLWTETQNLSFDQGYFSTQLGADASGNPLADSLFDADLWLEVTVGAGSPLPTRLQLVSVPFARKAGGVSGGVVDASEVQIGGTTVIDSSGAIDWSALGNVPAGLDSGENLGALGCADGQIAVQGSLGWACGDADAHSHHADDIVDGTLTVARLPVGSGASDVAAGDHLHGFGQITGQVADSQLPPSVSASAVPTGMVAMFDAACPSGWSSYAGLNGRIPRGEPTGDASSLDQGGSDDAIVVAHGHTASGSSGDAGDHSHAVTGTSGNQSANHTHGGGSFAAASGGAHTHSTTVGQHRHFVYSMPIDDRNYTGTTGGQQHGLAADASSYNPNYTHSSGANSSYSSSSVTVNSGGAHGHTISGSSGDNSAGHNHAISLTSGTDGAHNHSVSVTVDSAGASASGANLPAYAEMLFCQKD